MNFIQNLLGLVTRRKFLTNLTDRDTILVARDNARENAVSPNLEPKALKLKNLKDYVLLGAAGKEPYLFETLISEIDASGQRLLGTKDKTDTFGTTAVTLSVQQQRDVCIPFFFQQDVILKKVHLFVNTQAQETESDPRVFPQGLFGLYELTSVVDDRGFKYNFKKVYQDPTVFDLGDGSSNAQQTITLTTPQIFEAGKVYVLVVSFKYADGTGFTGSVQYNAPFPLNANKFLSVDSTQSLSGAGGSTFGIGLVASGINMTTTTLPDTIEFDRINTNSDGTSPTASQVGYKFMTVINA